MKATLLLFLACCLALSLRAQSPDSAYSAEQLDQMLGPVALYPDPLIALILPASTAPTDLTLAANYLAGHGSPDAIDAQPWDPSIKGLARYPDVVKWMNENLDWTQALGAAFARQPADVMKSIQQLRAQARAAGTLVDTPQQVVAMAGDSIRIVPAQTNVIYVPRYDPALVYETPVGDGGPLITFGIGFPSGVWLGYQPDWDNFGIWVGPWSGGWAYRREWRQPGGGNHWQNWHPDPRRSRDLGRNFYHPDGRLPGPRPMPGYHSPLRQPGNFPRPIVSHPSSRPDYCGLFGWTANQINQNGKVYTVFRNGSRPVAGLAPRASATTTRPSRWIGYLAVADLPATLQLVTKAGGRVRADARDFPSRGVQAIITDAEGAPLGLLQSSSGDAADTEPAPGDWNWFELYARQPPTASAFCHDALGYDATPDLRTERKDDFLLSSGGLPRAGVAPIPERADAKPGWLGVVRVAHLDDTLARVVDLGGAILVAARPAAYGSRFALISDSTGGHHGARGEVDVGIYLHPPRYRW